MATIEGVEVSSELGGSGLWSLNDTTVLFRAQEPNMEKKTILVVDDDVEIREAVTDLLERHGYEVVPASNGREALDELKDKDLRPALILLDLMMPVMDGQEFCAEQQNDPELRDIPVVVFTAFGAALEQMKEVESMPHIEKPVQADELLDSIELWSDDTIVRH